MEYNPLEFFKFSLKFTREMQEIRKTLDEQSKLTDDLTARRDRLVDLLDNSHLDIEDYIKLNDGIAEVDKHLDSARAIRDNLEKQYQMYNELFSK